MTARDRTVLGVDFSGAASPGEDLWIAALRWDNGRDDRESDDREADDRRNGDHGDDLTVVRCRSAADALGVAGRDRVLSALRDRLAESGVAAGIDAPLGLPAPILADLGGPDRWRDLPGWVADFEDPSALRSACVGAARRVTDGDRAHLLRVTDRDPGALSPYHFFTVQQCYHAVVDVAGPLLASGAVVAPQTIDGRGADPADAPGDRVRTDPVGTADPDRTGDPSDDRDPSDPSVDRPDPAGTVDPTAVVDPDADWPGVDPASVDGPVLAEAYPAGVLARAGLPAEGYKDDDPAARRRRERILDGLADGDAGPAVSTPEPIRDRILAETGGDALDAVLAGVATARALDRQFVPDRPYRPVEGHVYR